jgi:tRNA nucleotidyltransferase (CCA-adding enzyme)
MDSAALARQAYVMAYIKIRDYLRQPARKMSDKQAQARVGMDLVKHVESNKLSSLVPGRSKSDDTLLDEVKKLREQMKKQARTSFESEQEEGGLLRKPRDRSNAGESIPSNPKAQA